MIVLSLGLLLAAGAVYAQTSTSALQDGAPYMQMLGLGGKHDVPYISGGPTLDGVISPGEYDGYFYVYFGPSTLAQWAEIVGYKANDPGYVVADGLVSQLNLHAGGTESEAEAMTDADMFCYTWQAWDEDYLYMTVNVTDNVYDVSGSQDGGYWERDGFFMEIDFLNVNTTTAEVGVSMSAYCFSAMPVESARYSITNWHQVADAAGNSTWFYGDDPAVFKGTFHGFGLTDEGYVIEARCSWAGLTKDIPAGAWILHSGWNYSNSYHILDPDGGEGFGGQFQYGRDGDAGHVGGFARWNLVGGPATAVEATTWGAVKASFK